jgi:hypothetical protein
MNFFKTLLRPDREELESKEKAVIVAAANLLQIGEFQLLQLAYREWHGRDLPESRMDRLFASYMLGGKIPPWGRHYARNIIARAELGRINDRDPAYHRYDNEYRNSVPGGRVRFGLAVMAVFLAVGGGLVLAEMSVGSPAGLLPPYLDESTLNPRKQAFSWGRSDSVSQSQGLSTDGGQP